MAPGASRSLLWAVVLLGLAGSASAFVCGNNNAEPGEQCDDGNLVDGDGCSAACQIECETLTGTWTGSPASPLRWSILDDGTGNLVGASFDEVNPATMLALAGTVIGSGVGAAVTMVLNGAIVLTGSRTACETVNLSGGLVSTFALNQISVVVCGDGALEADEQCDDGNFTNGDGCTVACTLPACGNGIVEAGEECDDRNFTDGDGCSATCTTQTCGNGIVEPGEECDDGNLLNGDGCSHRCRLQACGNGILDSGEQCDDGNSTDGDGCSASCQIECDTLTGTWTDGPSGTLRWSILDDGTGNLVAALFDEANPASMLALTGTVIGSGVGAAVTMVFNGQIFFTGSRTACETVNLSGVSTFALNQISVVVCGDGALEAGEQCDDGNFTNGDGCTVACTLPACGNGIVEAGEQCDDGNFTDGDRCSATCTTQTCGNGIVEPGEECDDGNLINGDGCSHRCHLQACGNGILDSGEQCDDGNSTDGDGCSASCQIECDTLTGTWTGGPFGTLRWSILDDGVGNLIGAAFDEANFASALTLSGTRSGSGLGATVALAVDGTTLSFSGIWESCTTVSLSGTFAFTLALTSMNVCGNGLLEAGEQCDDGNFANGDDCTVACTLPGCGNGRVDPGEECDDGDFGNGDECDNNCTRPRCGNAVTDPNEQCDDGNLVAGDGCDQNCGVPGCPNGIVDQGEECDDGNLADNDTCARNCRLPGCGNNVLESTEQCDDGDAFDCNACSALCTIEPDPDADSARGSCDNCPGTYNPSQRDRDSNGVGDACDVPVSVATPAGSDIVVSDTPGSVPGLAPSPIIRIDITFDVVSSAGLTDVRTLEAPPGALLDANFKVSTLGSLFELETTAVVSGLIKVCVTYDDSRLTAGEEMALAFLHEEGGVLVDRTVSRDVAANLLCAQVTSLSPFGLGLPLAELEQTRAAFRLDLTRVGGDHLRKLSTTFRAAPDVAVDPSATGASFSLMRDGQVVFARSIPASEWDAVGRGYKFVDQSGGQASGITKATVSVSLHGAVRLRFRGQSLDLRAADAPSINVRYDLGSLTVAATLSCTGMSTASRATIRCKQ